MKNAVIIGCGQIGALYDFDNDLQLTHAKGYSLSSKFHLKSVIDLNEEAAKKVANKYSCEYLTDYSKLNLDEIDIVSICVHTDLHFEILNYLYTKKYSGYIILEKPVVKTDSELTKLKSFDKSFLDKIYVNYIRRFDATYADIIEKLKQKEFDEIESIQVNYFGEFEHNAVHALNIFNYIFKTKPTICYKDDTTIVLKYFDTKVVLNQLNSEYLNYDISFYTKTHKVVFSKLGYQVDIYKLSDSKKFQNIKELKHEYSKEVLDGYIVTMLDNILENNSRFPTVYEGILDLEIIKEIKKC